MCFDFLPQGADIKIQILFENLIFLRQTERKPLWKIDTISVVQELIWILALDLEFSIFNFQFNNGSRKILHLINSIILSYLIISFTTKSLILAQDER